MLRCRRHMRLPSAMLQSQESLGTSLQPGVGFSTNTRPFSTGRLVGFWCPRPSPNRNLFKATHLFYTSFEACCSSCPLLCYSKTPGTTPVQLCAHATGRLGCRLPPTTPRVYPDLPPSSPHEHFSFLSSACVLCDLSATSETVPRRRKDQFVLHAQVEENASTAQEREDGGSNLR